MVSELDEASTSPSATLIQVESITVRKLFGLYDHTIKLNVGDRVTIVHGPNGVGKTMILRLVAAMFGGGLDEFGRAPFEHFEVALTNRTRISVDQTRSDKLHKKRPQSGVHVTQSGVHVTLKISVNPAQGKPQSTDIDFDDRRYGVPLSALQHEFPWLNRAGPDRWLDERTDTILSTEEVMARYSEFLPSRYRHGPSEPEWFQAIRSHVRVHLIEAQRLLRLDPSPRSRVQAMVPTVTDYAQDLKGRVNGVLARYASESQSLDQSFPQRLLMASGGLLDIASIKERMTALDEKRTKLRSIGLLDDSGSYPFDIASLDKLEPAQRSVMSLYVKDTERKLGALDDLARRIELLRDNVNRKFSNKSMRFDREHGFSAAGHDGAPLDLTSLSSGEQHELVLLYDLLFRVQPNTLVLIDEPELSLHVGWQKRFLPELLQIVRTAQFDAVVATHSPFIVGDRSDLMVPLGTDTE